MTLMATKAPIRGHIAPLMLLFVCLFVCLFVIRGAKYSRGNEFPGEDLPSCPFNHVRAQYFRLGEHHFIPYTLFPSTLFPSTLFPYTLFLHMAIEVTYFVVMSSCYFNCSNCEVIEKGRDLLQIE